jgi:ATP-binding cassette, subfamily B, bacterial
VIASSIAMLAAPIVIAHVIDTAIAQGDYRSVIIFSGLLVGIFAIASAASYVQTTAMGGVGRRALFGLRNSIFLKLQELPVSFFNQNRAGDLISRINSDTEKLNQFIAQGLIQFIGNVFLMAGTAVFMLALDWELGIATLLPAAGVLAVTWLVSPWVKRRNLESLRTLGAMSSEIQENLASFKAIVAFNRLDYFREKFARANERNYSASVASGIAGNIFLPVYGLASNIAQLVALCFGLYLISRGSLTIGLLIGFQLYVTNFYNPLRQLAATWTSFQLALASLDRISEVLSLSTDMRVEPSSSEPDPHAPVLEFRGVSFGYPDGKTVLAGVDFRLEAGKTYALVGPTGGGKTTTASLMARLYDPTAGTVLLWGRDIRAYPARERGERIGFILQEPFLFSGTVRDNVFYGNAKYADRTPEELDAAFDASGLGGLLARFDRGLDTEVANEGGAMSLGQRQLIAFMRAVLREPELLILDEATANIDTVTEQLLESVLAKLPPTTAKVVIAHRLNTIKNADRIFFVNGGEITSTESVESALDLLLHEKRES